LFAALQLARLGVPARVIERELCPPRQARATALQPGTLEILAQAGIIDEFLASSVHLEVARVFDAALEPIAEMAFGGHRLAVGIRVQPAAVADRGDPGRQAGRPWRHRRARHRGQVGPARG
jgi:2-polyprenyl-6-methoxyphenol hydroxylase-like FAD-dependent oxidoreductase